MGVAGAKGVPMKCSGHIPLQCTLAASYCPVCNSPKNFLWPWDLVSEHTGQAGGPGMPLGAAPISNR